MLLKNIVQSMIDSTFKNCIEKIVHNYYQKTLTIYSYLKKMIWVCCGEVLRQKLHRSFSEFINYDRSCHLSCPTCRNEMIMDSPNSPNWKNMEKIHKIVTEEIIKDYIDYI